MQTNLIQLAVLPLASFWAMFTSLISAAKFVNDIRDTIISGQKDKCDMSIEHRRGLFMDWLLSMIGIIVGCIGFATVTYWMGTYIERNVTKELAEVALALKLVAMLPAIGAVLFIACGITDTKLIVKALKAGSQKVIQ